MTENLIGLNAVYLKPGEWYFGKNSVLVKTVLGSCVTVTMLHPGSGFAAICHAIMPLCTENGVCNSHCENSAKYVDCIVRRMAELFSHKNIKARNIQVKLFGGADTLSSVGRFIVPESVGTLNLREAMRSIEEVGLRVSTRDVGGTEGRRLFFNTRTGHVMIKKLHAVWIQKSSDDFPVRKSCSGGLRREIAG